jgi:hypothetical protein
VIVLQQAEARGGGHEAEGAATCKLMASKLRVQQCLGAVSQAEAMTTAASVKAVIKALNLEQSADADLLGQLLKAEERQNDSVKKVTDLQGQLYAKTKACTSEQNDKGDLSLQLQAAHDQISQRDAKISMLKQTSNEQLASLQRTVSHLTAELSTERSERDHALQSCKVVKQALSHARTEQQVRKHKQAK